MTPMQKSSNSWAASRQTITFIIRRRTRTLVSAALLLLTAVPAIVRAADESTKFEVYPSEFHLFTSRSAQSIICRVVQPDGVTRDVTDQVQWIVPDSQLIKMDHNIARPIADG